MTRTSAKSPRGFAVMDPVRQRQIASKGGKAAHRTGHAHQWNSEEARRAGRKGGAASHGTRKTGRENKKLTPVGEPGPAFPPVEPGEAAK